MSIAETVLTAEALEEDIRQEMARRYAFERMLRATDRVLWRLEALNAQGVKELSVDDGRRIRALLVDAGLPEVALAELRGGTVQKTLDSIFSAQDALFLWRDPDREAADDTAECHENRTGSCRPATPMTGVG